LLLDSLNVTEPRDNTADDIVPPLLHMLRERSLPTSLRSSTLTILATAVEESPLALLPRSEDLAQTCIDVLRIESRPLKPRARQAPASSSPEVSDEEEGPAPQRRRRPEETPDPTGTDSKHPSLRRAALLFLAMLLRTARGTRGMLSSQTRASAKVVIAYLAQTDEDALVRHQSSEILDEM
jgi:hypothetical protein